jgi:hypothetical protein
LSREGMERIVEKALTDESFRTELFANPRQACASFKLTEAEFHELMGGMLRSAERRPQLQPEA